MLDKDKTEEEKSFELANLAGWNVKLSDGRPYVLSKNLPYGGGNEYVLFEPYAKNKNGFAQAQAILMQFPKVILRFVSTTCDFQQGDYQENLQIVMAHEDGSWTMEGIEKHKLTQENFLNEVLMMNHINLKANPEPDDMCP